MTAEISSRDTNVLPLTAPFDFTRSISFWKLSTLELCEQWADGVYRRAVVVDGRARVLEVISVGEIESPVVRVMLDGVVPTSGEMDVLTPLVRQLLGADADLRGFYASVRGDPVLADVTRQLYGVRPPRSPLWETLCWVVIGQQISLPFARILKARLVARYADTFDVAGRALHVFPSPERLAVANIDDLLAMQFSRNKASFVVGLAQSVVAGALDLAAIPSMPTEEAVEYLMQFRGVGRWTAEFTLMRALGRRDVLPANDAGVRQGVTGLYGQKLAEAELRVFAERWGDWRGLVALYLLGWLKIQREQRSSMIDKA